MGSMLRRLSLLVVLAVVAWVLYSWAQGEDLAVPVEVGAGPLFPGLEVDSVTFIHMTLDQGHDLELQRDSGGRWSITAPTTEQAREELVAQWLDNLARATYEPLESEGAPLAAADLGLEPPLHELTIGLVDGRRHTLLIGDVDPLGRSVYARGQGLEEIGLVTRNVISLTRFHGEEWVDPNLLRGLQGGITTLRVIKPDGLLLDAVLQGGRWILRGRQAVLPDNERIASLLRGLRFARTERVLASRPSPDESRRLGFPTAVQVASGDYAGCTYIEVGNPGEGSIFALLAPGWERSGDDVVARRGDGDKVIAVPAGAFALLRNDFEFFRDHRLIPPVRERATSLRLESGGEILLDVRRGAKGLWAFHAPQRLAGELLENERRFGRSALTDLFARIDALEVRAFDEEAGAAGSTGPAGPRLTVGWERTGRARYDSVTFGTAEASGVVHASSSLRPHEGLVVSAAALALFDPIAADLLRTMEPLDVNAERWWELVIRHPGLEGPLSIRRDADGAWVGDDAWGRRFGIARDALKGFRGFHWRRARPGADYPAAISFRDADGMVLDELRLRRPADDEPDEVMGTPAAIAALPGFEGLELVVPALWINRVQEMDAAPAGN